LPAKYANSREISHQQSTLNHQPSTLNHLIARETRENPANLNSHKKAQKAQRVAENVSFQMRGEHNARTEAHPVWKHPASRFNNS
jgi:hypothetical protein